MQVVNSYDGAMLFVEFLSEMRRSFDLRRGMICAQTFIYFCHVLFSISVVLIKGTLQSYLLSASIFPFLDQMLSLKEVLGVSLDMF